MDPSRFVGDPFLWYAEGRFHMIQKDMSGSLTGAFGNGVYAYSSDAIDWQLGKPALCHERIIT